MELIIGAKAYPLQWPAGWPKIQQHFWVADHPSNRYERRTQGKTIWLTESIFQDRLISLSNSFN